MTDITTNLPEKVATAIKRAYALGQLYWQQADSDSYKQNAKSDETRAKFDELLFQASANVQEAADEIDRLRAEVAAYAEANRYMADELEDALEDARKYAEAQREIARLREALEECVPALEIGLDAGATPMTARIEVHNDEIAEKIDELVDLCQMWTMNRRPGAVRTNVRAAIVMTAQDIAALVRVQGFRK